MAVATESASGIAASAIGGRKAARKSRQKVCISRTTVRLITCMMWIGTAVIEAVAHPVLSAPQLLMLLSSAQGIVTRKASGRGGPLKEVCIRKADHNPQFLMLQHPKLSRKGARIRKGGPRRSLHSRRRQQPPVSHAVALK